MRLIVLAAFFVAGCSGGGASKDAASPKPDAKEAGAPGSSSAAADAGPADAGGGKPFAGSAAEATQLITEAVDKKQDALKKCVQEYRYRTHLAHDKVTISIGIDQEGRIIGVMLPKNKEDKDLTACVQGALKDTVFPRSHAGVITIMRSFEEMVQ
jgi:hypothetical protein